MIQVKNISKAFKEAQVLSDISIDFEPGKINFIIGRSGQGKSVLLKHIIGITKPDAGSVDIDNVRISDVKGADLYKAVKHMGMLFQGGALFDSMNVEDNTAFYLNQHGDPKTGKGYPKKEIADLVAHALEMVVLRGHKKKCLQTYRVA